MAYVLCWPAKGGDWPRWQRRPPMTATERLLKLVEASEAASDGASERVAVAALGGEG